MSKYKQKHDMNLVYIGLYLADDSTADPQYFVDSWKCITKALQPIKIEKQNLTQKKNQDHVPLNSRCQYPYCSLF